MNPTLILILAPFLAPQEPAPDWSPLARESFLEAVHRLEVGAAPEDAQTAWDLLATLADRGEFAGRPGELALLRAEMRRAALRLGRLDEARRLAEEARELAAGTPREAEVQALLEQEPAPPQEVAPEFLALVRSALETGAVDELRTYGRRVGPALLRLLDPDSPDAVQDAELLVRSGGGREWLRLPLGRALLASSLAVASPELMDALVRRIRGGDWAPAQLAAFLEGPDAVPGVEEARSLFRVSAAAPVDGEAAEALDAFLAELTRDPDLARARVGILVCADRLRLRRHPAPELAGRVAEILGDPESPLAGILVEHLPWEKVGEDLGPPLPWELQAARCPQPQVAAAARWKLLRAGRVPVLLELARDGDGLDRLRLAASCIRARKQLRREQDALAEVLAGQDPEWRHLRMWGRSFVLEELPGLAEALAGLLESRDALERRVAALAAASQGWLSLLPQALAGTDPEVRRIALLALEGVEELPPGLEDPLAALLADPELGTAAARVLLQAGARLGVQEFLACARRLPEAEKELKRSLRAWMQLPDGPARLLAVARDPGLPLGLALAAADLALQRDRAAPDLSETVQALLAREEDRREVDAWLASVLPDVLEALLDREWPPGPGGGPSPLLQAALERAFAFVQEDRARGELTYGWPDVLWSLVRLRPASGPAWVAGLAPDAATAVWFLEQGFLGPGLTPETRVEVLSRLAVRFPDSVVLLDRARKIFQNPPLVPEALDRLLALREPGWVAAALEMLAGHPEAVAARRERLLELLHDPALAAAVAEVLLRADRAFIPTVLEVADLPGMADRERYLRALGMTGDPRVVPVLLDALQSPDPALFGTARDALERLRSIQEQRAWWESWQAFGLGGDPVAALLAKVRSGRREVRMEAIRALGTLGAKEALPVLVALLEDEDPAVQAAAREALERIHAAATPRDGEETEGRKEE